MVGVIAKRRLELADINLKKLSLAELDRLAKRIAREIKSKEARNKKDARQALEKVAKEYGVSIEDIVSGAKKTKKTKGKAKPRAKAAPKYRNPDDAAQTWSGRGRRPEWYKAALAAGKSEKDLAI